MPAIEKLDLKKKWKQLYQPASNEINTVHIPPLSYLMVDGKGDPNTSQPYHQAIEALYALSYTLKFCLKKSPLPMDYGVMPLEGLWWSGDGHSFNAVDKSIWKWTVMILQPDCITSAELVEAFEQVRKKKNPAALDDVRFATMEEGDAVQTLYVGPYFDEAPTIQRMHDAIHAAGRQLCGKHHEIYLSDPRRTAPEKLKTILRQPMR